MISKATHSVLAGTCIAAALLVSPAAAAAPTTAPRSFVASPEIYKVIADKGDYVVVLATWKPGERDTWHSHPEAGIYFVTACALRVFKPDGTHVDFKKLPQGHGFVQQPIASHEAQNIGSHVCKLVMFEHK